MTTLGFTQIYSGMIGNFSILWVQCDHIDVKVAAYQPQEEIILVQIFLSLGHRGAFSRITRSSLDRKIWNEIFNSKDA
jgi:hypothetical protein